MHASVPVENNLQESVLPCGSWELNPGPLYEMVQQVRAHTALAEDPRSVPRVHIGQLPPITLASGDPTPSPGLYGH